MVLCSAKVKLIQGCCGNNSWRFRAQRINRFKWKSSLLTMLFVPNPAPENLGKQTFTWWRNAISAVPHISHVFAYSRGFPKQNFPCWSGTQQLPWQETKLWRNQIDPASGRTHSWKLCMTQKIPSFSASYFTCLIFSPSFSIPSAQIPQGSGGATILGIVDVALNDVFYWSWRCLVKSWTGWSWKFFPTLFYDSMIHWACENAKHLQLQGHCPSHKLLH